MKPSFWLILSIPLITGLGIVLLFLTNQVEAALIFLPIYALVCAGMAIYGGVKLAVQLSQDTAARVLLGIVLSIAVFVVYAGVSFGTCMAILSRWS